MSDQPLVTVLMPVFNDAAFLPAAVESILEQTFSDFDFLIVDDGSSDGSEAFLQTVRDSRVRLVRNERNIGLTRSLRLGLELARGRYIARMDADDISFRERLARQVSFLYKHPYVGILGTACQLIDARGHSLGFGHRPATDVEIRWASLLENPFYHPTVMIRRSLLVDNNFNYDEAFRTTQDYELWTRMLTSTVSANLSEPLVKYRVRHGITSTHRRDQLRNHDIIACRTIAEQFPGFEIRAEQVSRLRRLFFGGDEPWSALEAHRVSLAGLYLDLFRAFEGHHRGKPAIKALRRQQAMKVAQIVLRRPLPRGWLGLLWRLVALDPGLPGSHLGRLSHAFVRRLGRRLSSSETLHKTAG
ncbi:MAG: glycosyltransferase [Candidatus Marsarchaeota archaeon]|nr:glycosyltransferase [Candidatus Marsarchaeota archaeon]